MKVKEAITQAVEDASARQMKLLRRTACRAVLEYARIRQQTVSYLDLAEVLSTFSGGSELANILGEIATEDYEAYNGLVGLNWAQRAVLPALVVRKDTGRPGKGFFTYLGALGATYGEWVDDGAEDPSLRKSKWVARPLIDKGVYDPTMDDRCIAFWSDMVCNLLGPNVAVKTTADKSHSKIVFTSPQAQSPTSEIAADES